MSSGCQHHCVVCIVCMDYAFLAFVTLHAVRDSQLPCTVFDRVGVMAFFPSLFLLDLSSSFSPSFPSGDLFSVICLPDQVSHFSFNSRLCVDLSFFIILPQAFVFGFFLGLPFFSSFFAAGICVQFLSLPVQCLFWLLGCQSTLRVIFRQTAHGVRFSVIFCLE